MSRSIPARDGARKEAKEHLVHSSVGHLEQQFRALAAVLEISLRGLVDPEESEDRTRGLLEVISLATHAENQATQAQNQALQEQIVVDSLTAIGNRRAFDQQLDVELDRSMRYQHPLSLIMLDLDRFKQINDRYGHLTGDVVLKEVASRIKQALSQCDFAARYRSEGFAIIASETRMEGARQRAERLRRAIQQPSIPTRPKSSPALASLRS